MCDNLHPKDRDVKVVDAGSAADKTRWPPWRDPMNALEPKLPPQSRLAAMFTVSATMIVLNTKPTKPCTVANLRSFREVICTSDT